MRIKRRKTVTVTNPNGEETVKMKTLFTEEQTITGDVTTDTVTNLRKAIVDFKGFTDDDGDASVTETNKKAVMDAILEDHTINKDKEDTLFERMIKAFSAHEDLEKSETGQKQ